MEDYERLRMLKYPKGRPCVVIDTDAATEVDDPFAIAYALCSGERLDVRGIYAAPFSMNERAERPEEGMNLSYEEILRILRLCGRSEALAFRGATEYGSALPSQAAKHLIALSRTYDQEKPLYVAALGAITNIAAAIRLEPDIIRRIVVVWLASDDFDRTPNAYNVYQDVGSAQVVFDSGVPLVHVPCNPVTSHLTTGVLELEAFIGGKNALCDYLIGILKEYEGGSLASGKPLWDVGVIGYLMKEAFTSCEIVTAPVITEQLTWSKDYGRHLIKNVKTMDRNGIFKDMYEKLAGA